VHVSSAGTLDLGPVAAHKEALALAPGLGIDLSEHRARCLSNVDMREADLVVGFERMHVATAVVDAGVDRRRAFTLPELAEHLADVSPKPDGDPVARARSMVEAAAELRQLGGAMPEIADPIGQPAAVFAATGEQVAGLTSAVARALFPGGGTPD
jgi:protein-tyrosine-phosphatase